MTYYFVYKTTNLENDKYYIGVHKTDNLDDGYLGSGVALKRAVKKYGKDSFSREILKNFDTCKEAFEYEKEIVNEDLVNDKTCYNISVGGKGGIHNEEHLRIIKLTNIGIVRSDETKRKISEANKGKITSDETRKKLSEAHKNRPPVSDETRKKIGDSHRGKFVSDETRKKLSEAGKGNKLSDETKSKIGLANKGKITSDETKRKMSESQKGEKNHNYGKKASEETKRKMSEAHKNRIYPILTCPHCGKESKSKGNLTRWHFDNCKKK